MDPLYFVLNEHGVATLIINRPHRANAINDEIIYSIITALDDLSNNSSVRILVIKSSGYHFSAGLDAYWQSNCIDANGYFDQNITAQLSRLYSTLYEFPHPTLAVVEGKAYSDSVGLVACCDFVLASETSEFILNDMEYGIPPALSIPYLVKAIGERATKELALLCKPLTASQALRLGLVTSLASSDLLQTEEKRLIESLLKHNRELTLASKSLIQFCANEPFDDAQIDYSMEVLDDMKSKPEFIKGLKTLIKEHTNGHL